MTRIIRLEVSKNKIYWWIPGDTHPREASIRDLIMGYELFIDAFPNLKDSLKKIFQLPVIEKEEPLFIVGRTNTKDF